jgi:hypothetical protein
MATAETKLRALLDTYSGQRYELGAAKAHVQASALRLKVIRKMLAETRHQPVERAKGDD